VDAVLEAPGDCAVRLALRAEALATLAASPDFAPLRTTFRRVMGLSREHLDSGYEPALLAHPSERALHVALLDVAGRASAATAALDYRAALAAMVELKEPVDRFFDGVLVMADDPAVRHNRLGLLRGVANLFRAIADFTKLSAEG
jgi:glycyl-tRNA synthetase beta chain